jgi:hypothetical protein
VTENQEDAVKYYGTTTQAVLEDLTPGERYTYRIKSTSLVGDSLKWSDQYTFLIVDEPTAPLNLIVTGFDNTYVSLIWEQPLKSGG